MTKLHYFFERGGVRLENFGVRSPCEDLLLFCKSADHTAQIRRTSKDPVRMIGTKLNCRYIRPYIA